MPPAEQVADVARRVDAVEQVALERGLIKPTHLEAFSHKIEGDWTPATGAAIVARAWTDAAYKARLLQNGIAAAAELGATMPAHHRHLVVLENTATVHNVICCTLCSCTAFSIIGMPPDWYKDLEYRSRVVRESRTVLREMGLDLSEQMEIRVWDTTADTRYVVLPYRPPETEGWTPERLKSIVTKESMIGVARLEPPTAYQPKA
ncbi:MAG TPA: nitrile hydratase subunit alpha [Burkholderiales bacterium]|jgi:nitrile hydratase